MMHRSAHTCSASTCTKNSGFTLVEVLLTMAILSMVMLTATYAYNYITQNWQRNQQLYQRDLQQYMSTALVYRSITDMQPKMVRSAPVNVGSGELGQPGFYFLGRENGFTGYTNTALQNPLYPAVFRLFRERASDGSWRLVYEEAVLRDTALAHADQELPFAFRVVVASGLQQVLFEYYGWQNLRTRLGQDPELQEEFASPQWFTDYDGLVRRQHPLTVQVHLDEFLWPISITDITQELFQQVSGDDA